MNAQRIQQASWKPTALAAVLLLLGALGAYPAQASVLGGENPAPGASPSPQDPLGAGYVDWFDADLGTVECSGTFEKVPEGDAPKLSHVALEYDPPALRGSSPGDSTAPAPSPEPDCPWCAVAGVVIAGILLAIKLYEIIRDLTSDPDFTYHQTITCTASDYSVWATGSGGVLRRMSIVHEGEIRGTCDYNGVLDGGGCRADILNPGGALEYVEDFYDDIVHLKAEPCFVVNAVARNTPQIDPLGLLQKDEKSFSHFWKDGQKCAPLHGIAWTEVFSAGTGLSME